MPPKVLAKSERAGGVLPVNAAARATPAKAPAIRLKLEIRRLPPSLTLTEFEEILGEEWKLGKGKVDWREYRQGKIKSPGKMPEQSRCYVHLKNEHLVSEFENRFLGVLFHDKAGTHKFPELRQLLPSLGFAPNQRSPLQTKPRADNRQGTIDQDSEFIAFLEAETMPLTKAAAVENLGVEREKPEPIKSTPLIDDLREKKANKAKAAANKVAATKAEKEKDKKAAAHGRHQSKDAPVETESKTQTSKVEQAAKEATKVLNKQASSKQQQQKTGQSQAQTQQSDAKSVPTSRQKKPAQTPKPQSAAAAAQPAAAGRSSPAPQRGPAQRQRGNNAEGIKKMLQKDLGIKPKTTPTNPVSAKQNAQPVQPSRTVTSPHPAPVSIARPPAAPAAQTVNKQATATKATSAPTATPSSGVSATKAYLKHANPSQGMTEALIMKALGEYGEMVNVTIDPRKGTAIAVFKDNAGLKKAMGAKRVTVANGAIEVLEFKERQGGAGAGSGSGAAGQGGSGRGGLRGNRGGARAGRGAANVAASATPSAPPAAASPKAPQASAPPAPS
nr:isoform 2 of regulator of nonsense transcripts upf3 [Quercus suber]